MSELELRVPESETEPMASDVITALEDILQPEQIDDLRQTSKDVFGGDLQATVAYAVTVGGPRVDKFLADRGILEIEGPKKAA